MMLKDLSCGEKYVLDCLGRGESADFLSAEDDESAAIRPENREFASVRAAFLVDLINNYDATKDIRTGVVQIRGAQVSGPLDLVGSNVHLPFFLEGCTFTDPINLTDARLRSFSLAGSWFPQLLGQNLIVSGDLLLRRLCCPGSISLCGASVTGDVNLADANLGDQEQAYCLRALGLRVDHRFIMSGSVCNGSIDLSGARIGAEANFNGAVITAVDEKIPAIRLNRARVGATLSMSQGFSCIGGVHLLNAQVENDIRCVDARFDSGGLEHAFLADGTLAKGALIWAKHRSRPIGNVGLGRLKVGQLADELESWPDAGKLDLRGFEYGTIIATHNLSAQPRIAWLSLQSQDKGAFSTQPYEQLTRVFRALGLDRDAREVAIAKQWALLKHGQLPIASKLAKWFLGVTIAFGYKPQLCLIYIAVVILLGTVVFDRAAARDVMVPTNPLKVDSISASTCTDKYPCFMAFIYSLDLFIPIISFDVVKYWRADASAGFWFYCYSLVHIALGWLLSTVAVAAVAGVIRKD